MGTTAISKNGISTGDYVLEILAKTRTTQTDRTIYQWSEPSKVKKGILDTKTSVWTHVVRNRIRQKTGETQEFKSPPRNGVEKTPNGMKPISEEGQNLLEDKDR